MQCQVAGNTAASKLSHDLARLVEAWRRPSSSTRPQSMALLLLVMWGPSLHELNYAVSKYTSAGLHGFENVFPQVTTTMLKIRNMCRLPCPMFWMISAASVDLQEPVPMHQGSGRPSGDWSILWSAAHWYVATELYCDAQSCSNFVWVFNGYLHVLVMHDIMHMELTENSHHLATSQDSPWLHLVPNLHHSLTPAFAKVEWVSSCKLVCAGRLPPTESAYAPGS